MMKSVLALILCAVMLTMLSACTPSTPNVPSLDSAPTRPEPQDATGSSLIGEWSVSAKKATFDKLTFFDSGAVYAHFGASILAGVFIDSGSSVSIEISQQKLEGTYTIDGDVITIVTETDVLVLKKLNG